MGLDQDLEGPHGGDDMMSGMDQEHSLPLIRGVTDAWRISQVIEVQPLFQIRINVREIIGQGMGDGIFRSAATRIEHHVIKIILGEFSSEAAIELLPFFVADSLITIQRDATDLDSLQMHEMHLDFGKEFGALPDELALPKACPIFDQCAVALRSIGKLHDTLVS